MAGCLIQREAFEDDLGGSLMAIIDLIRILTVGLERACDRGSCRGIICISKDFPASAGKSSYESTKH